MGAHPARPADGDKSVLTWPKRFDCDRKAQWRSTHGAVCGARSAAETPPLLISRGRVGELSAFDQHASVALSAAHTLPICFHEGLGAGSGVEGVRRRQSLPHVDKAPPFSTVVTACRRFKGSVFLNSWKSRVKSVTVESLSEGSGGATIQCPGHQCSQ